MRISELTEGLYKGYHGSKSSFPSFDKRFLGTANGTAPINMLGFNFSNSEEVAKTFGPNVVAATIRIDRPLVIDAEGRIYSDFKHILNDKLDRNLSKYDGVIIKNYADAGTFGSEYIVSDHYIPFSVSQIKPIVTEAPIVNWEIDPNFDANEAEMLSKRTGYAQEKKHWPDVDKRAIRDPEVVQKIKAAFDRTGFPFNVYFWQSSNLDYDSFLQYGEADHQWLVKNIGEEGAMKLERPDTINILMTNNISDENPISIKSPWMFAHRIAHAMAGQESSDITNYFDDFVKRITANAYGVQWPKERDHGWHYTDIMNREFRQIYGKILGHHLGTMQSAKKGALTNNYEWYYETFAQYLITGKITFGPLPDQIHPEEVMTTDPVKKARAEKYWEAFPKQMERRFKMLLKNSVGKTFVI